MSLAKKLVFVLFLAAFAGGGALYCVNSKDHYDPSKYSASVTGGLERGGIQAGTTIKLTLPDQFDVSHTIGPEITTLILAFSKDSGGTVRNYLDDQKADYLTKHKAVFIADISPFPVFLRNTFALPKLRKSPYPVLLIYESKMATALKNKKHADEITIATLDKGVVKSVRYIASKDELARSFN